MVEPSAYSDRIAQHILHRAPQQLTIAEHLANEPAIHRDATTAVFSFHGAVVNDFIVSCSRADLRALQGGFPSM